jgi:ATP-dependent Clp protease adaptor protein ClpS
MSTKTEVQQTQSTKSKTKIKPPSLYNVIYINDDQTTMEFVVESLKIIFYHTEETAKELTLKIHEDGSSVVKTLPYEIAEQKGVEVTMLARNNGFPLAIKLQPA